MDISKYAKGLPDLFGLKERGKGLPALADQLVAVSDARDLYLLNSREVVAFTNIAAPVGGMNFFTERVPAGELWYVWNYSVGSAPGAGAAIDLAPGVNLDGLPLSWIIGDQLAAAATQTIQVSNRDPFWAGAGTFFGALVRSVTLAPAIAGAVLITRLKV